MRDYFSQSSAEVSGHFDTSAEVSCGQYGTGAEVSRLRSVLGLKCLCTEVYRHFGPKTLRCEVS